jgi:GTP cyclohydrolase FolE2
MAITALPGGGVIIEGKEDIALMRLLTLQSALRLESKGIRMSRQMSALAVAKRDYGLKGSRVKITAAIDKLVTEAKARRVEGCPEKNG